MIGHVHGDDEVYGLIGEARGRRRSLPIGSCGVLTLFAGCVGIGLLTQRAATRSGGSAVMLTMLETDAASTCAKPFGQCAGMNFSAPKDERDKYNFTNPGSAPFTCCPEGMSCMSMGPVWGMCMPAWGAGKPSDTAEMLRSIAVYEHAYNNMLLEEDAEEDADAAESTGNDADAESTGTADDSTAKEDESKKKDEPAACVTKPFTQCAGMNFTQTKTERDAYNFTAGAGQFACCPAGTSCVNFGPVFGMCMPSWGGPPAA